MSFYCKLHVWVPSLDSLEPHEKEIFNNIDDETIMQRFQTMKNCQGKLLKPCFIVEMTFDERNVCELMQLNILHLL